MSANDRRSIDEPLRYWREGDVFTIRFNRPKQLNSISIETARSFLSACKLIQAGPEIRVVVISAEGSSFVSGGDVAQMAESPVPTARRIIDSLNEALEILASLPVLVVASVRGIVAGGGFGIALSCDFVVAAQDTRFIPAYVGIGTSCDCGTSWSLPRLVGWRKAMEMIVLNQTLSADAAFDLNLVTRVVPSDELEQHTEQLVSEIANGPTIAIGQIKKLMRQSLQSDLHEQLAAESAAFLACAATNDFSEGLNAFLQKRAAKFTGS